MTDRIHQRRLLSEFHSLQQSPPPGIRLKEASDMNRWIIELDGPAGTLYDGESFLIQFSFTSEYPIDSPEVIFIDRIPVNEHIYSNGHVCLSILYDHWSPALTVVSVCLSIQSMLAASTEKTLPPGNEIYVRTCKESPKKTLWEFHGNADTCRTF